MKRLTVIMVILAFCLPARAEILIFQTSTKGRQLDVASKIVEKKSERGYLVIDVDLSNTDSVTINEALYLHYETKAGSKIQYTTILNTDNVELILVNYGKNKAMVVRWFDDDTGTYTVVYGTATMKTIGTGLQRYTASTLSGNSVWRQVDYRTGSGTVKLKLDSKATNLANNTPGTTVETVIEAYSLILQTKGYSSE
jgi:hypothetical protein